MKIGIVGAAGRMGCALARAVAEADGCALAAASERPGHEAIGSDAGALAGLGELGIAIGEDPGAVFAGTDAVLDFTAPKATVRHAGLAAESGTVLVTGTTGLEPDDQTAIIEAARAVALVQAPNFSVGVNLAFALTERAAALLDEEFDIEVVEMHHRHKVDAPSGTALGLGGAAAKGRGVALDQVSERGRDGITGARERGAIGFASLRGGDVVGEHTVIFAGPAERIEITHKAGGREIFARGAVRAAIWAADKPAGLYTMADVLGFNS
ncbi:MAG TPA: 4-hydroxy-tetrahydrodipicolinate reductase [Alphaproteobacteria bacterium]|nr:4-hydroxy-tetrahydrodipicolinate reductase [Alphaproteobacteria bacterium]